MLDSICAFLFQIPGYLAAAILTLHLLFSFVFKKKPLKLDQSSLIVITGGCMGIGLQMAL